MPEEYLPAHGWLPYDHPDHGRVWRDPTFMDHRYLVEAVALRVQRKRDAEHIELRDRGVA